jgi:hypothetical protein
LVLTSNAMMTAATLDLSAGSVLREIKLIQQGATVKLCVTL